MLSNGNKILDFELNTNLVVARKRHTRLLKSKNYISPKCSCFRQYIRLTN